MRNWLVLTCVVLTAMAARAADPTGFALWTGKTVAEAEKGLPGKVDAEGFAWYSLADYDNHLLGISHRQKDGMAELHETQTDILIVQEGKATLIVGGSMVSPKQVKANEIRGTAIEGGEAKEIGPGDIIHIPAKVPHQLKIASGTKFTYLVIKVDSK